MKNSLINKIENATPKQWIRFSVLSFLWICFCIWVNNFLLLLLILVFFDAQITKIIPWTFWKKTKNRSLYKMAEWIDAIVFGLIGVYFVNTFFFQNYKIPTSSLEKSLLVGDYLLVSKLTYGPRVPMTPLSFPLAQHTMPIIGGKSYIEHPQWDYKRLNGLRKIKRNDIVVFNFPAGDSVATNYQAVDYYLLSALDPKGSVGIKENPQKYGKLVYRPVDRRENYVKRCIGMPGDTLQLINDTVHINGKAIPFPPKSELNYLVQTDGSTISDELFDELGISKEDIASANVFSLNETSDDVVLQYGLKTENGQKGLLYQSLPLTQEMVRTLKTKPFVWSIIKTPQGSGNGLYYPLHYSDSWNNSNYGPIWIPKRGAVLTFDQNVDFKLAAYKRCIVNYEGNRLEKKADGIYINDVKQDSYTFKYDYYFMMGDNRDNSADSRVWGFVPEDHIVGTPILIWLSLDKDKGWFNGKIRWNRIFRKAQVWN